MNRSFSVKPTGSHKIHKRKIDAADDINPFLEDTDSLSDSIDDIKDTVDDIQDAVDDANDGVQDPEFDVRNNIENHYIAECDECHEIFISAVVESDAPVESIHGECPLCHEDTDQTMKWIVRPISDASADE